MLPMCVKETTALIYKPTYSFINQLYVKLGVGQFFFSKYILKNLPHTCVSRREMKMSSTTSFFFLFLPPWNSTYLFWPWWIQTWGVGLRETAAKESKGCSFCIHEILFQQNFESLEINAWFITNFCFLFWLTKLPKCQNVT